MGQSAHTGQHVTASMAMDAASSRANSCSTARKQQHGFEMAAFDPESRHQKQQQQPAMAEQSRPTHSNA